MPTSTSNKLASDFISHDVNLMRLQADHRRAILKALKKLERELVQKILSATGDLETLSMTRSKALLRTVRDTIETGYRDIYTDHKRMTNELAEYEASAAMRLVNKQLGVSLLAVGVPQSVLASMASDATVIGAPLKSFWDQQSVGLRNRFTTAMRAGVFAGETPYQLIQRVRGTKARNFTDGIMQASRTGAEVVTRTAAQSVLNDARMAAYQANGDVIKGVQALVTLDQRTSSICIARSGFAWTLEGEPLPGTKTDEDFPGPPPWHPNCRSTLVPVLKSFQELSEEATGVRRKIKALPKSTQASMDGQVADHLTYEQWLRQQSKEVQVSVLGEGRWKLWQQRKISLRDLIDQRGNPLTLQELRNLES